MDATTSDPEHYKRFQIEPKDFIFLNKLNWHQGNIVKYVCRYDQKNGLEDLWKAKQYLDFLIEAEYGIGKDEC